MPVKCKQVFKVLKNYASEMRTITCDEIAEEVGVAEPKLAGSLGFIRDEVCRRRGLPWLNAIAVNAETWRPAEGFLPEGSALTSNDEEFLWRGMILLVFAYDWSGVNFEA